MYCPQCGQQQASEMVRFCSRCGLPLNVVSDVVASGGALPAHLAQTPHGQRQSLSPRQKGIRQGAMMMLSTLFVVPLVVFIFVAMMHGPGELIPIAAVGLTMGGLLRILYALLFEDKTPTAPQDFVMPYTPPHMMHAPSNRPEQRGTALPPQQSVPASNYMPPRRANPSDMNAPPSVTDHTTKLLRDEPDSDARR